MQFRPRRPGHAAMPDSALPTAQDDAASKKMLDETILNLGVEVLILPTVNFVDPVRPKPGPDPSLEPGSAPEVEPALTPGPDLEPDAEPDALDELDTNSDPEPDTLDTVLRESAIGGMED